VKASREAKRTVSLGDDWSIDSQCVCQVDKSGNSGRGGPVKPSMKTAVSSVDDGAECEFKPISHKSEEGGSLSLVLGALGVRDRLFPNEIITLYNDIRCCGEIVGTAGNAARLERPSGNSRGECLLA